MSNKIYNENDIKCNLATNIARYRKAYNLTQAQLAEKLNYSDKAVSKWERAESVPDLAVLKIIADLFHVKIDTLLEEPKHDKNKGIKNISKRRLFICLGAVAFVWLIAICCFAFIDIIIPWIHPTWLFFIYAIPVSLVVVFILTSVWGKTLTNMILVSLFFWSLLTSIFLTLIHVLPYVPHNLWEIFLIGLPLQGLTVFGFLYKKTK